MGVTNFGYLSRPDDNRLDYFDRMSELPSRTRAGPRQLVPGT